MGLVAIGMRGGVWPWLSRWTNRLYLRRRGAHCCCASPMIRISESGNGEMRAASWLIFVVRPPEVTGDISVEVEKVDSPG